MTLEVVAHPGDPSRSRHAAKTKQRHSAAIRREIQPIHQARLDRRHRQPRHSARSEELDVAWRKTRNFETFAHGALAQLQPRSQPFTIALTKARELSVPR